MAVSVRAANAWNKKSFTHGLNWWSSPACRAYYSEAVCGEPLPGTSEGCRRRLSLAAGGRKLERAISIGCGLATKEIEFLKEDIVGVFDLWEIAPNLAEQGTATAHAEGVGDRAIYHIGDAFKNKPTATYDLVHWDHSLHHMSDVDMALAWSVASLKPGGFVYINDYLGPNRLQFSRTEVDLANAFRAKYGVPGKSRPPTLISRLRQWHRDPSEAPQSELIEAAIRKHLPGTKIEPIGGVLLNMLGGDVVPIAMDENQHILDAMLVEDRRIRESGLSHFAFALWQKHA